jgi:glycosyltransferase involved in cell wall biosynthesis
MRIAFYGNIANNFYQIAKELRTQLQVDAHLFIDAYDPIGMRPENDSPTIKSCYPDWIHEGHYMNRKTILFPWTSKLIKELGQYDAVVVSYLGPMFAPFIKRPIVFLATGSDLTVFPFPKEFLFLAPALKSKISSMIKGFWQRHGIRRVSEIWAPPFPPFQAAIKKLRVNPIRISTAYLPLAIDGDKFKLDENVRTNQDGNIQRIVSSCDFMVFHPSRLMLQDYPQLKASGQWKRNDLLFRGFAKFIERSGTQRSFLVMPDRTQSNDLAIGKRVIHEMGLDRHVLWIKPPSPEGFTRDELILFYSLADVVASDFGIGWFGSVVLEALAISRPVINSIDESVMKQLYPWHPILSANTAEEICDHLMRLYTDPEYKREVGRKGRQWMEEFHSGMKVSTIYVKKLMELSNRVVSGRYRIH